MPGLRILLPIAISLIAGVGACASSPSPQVNAPRVIEAAHPAPENTCAAAADKVQEGKASWYGSEFQGKKTASGERFDPNAPTAAHPNLPLGTQIDVTNLENGRETTLTVNDRGPKAKGRVLDVSKKGAQELGFTKDGLASVRIEPKTGAC